MKTIEDEFAGTATTAIAGRYHIDFLLKKIPWVE